jgi:uncharacterized membrane protein YGL010W
MKNIQTWLDEYGESHRNETNKSIHWICVPLIFFSLVALLYAVKLPYYIGTFRLNVALLLIPMVIVYYLLLSKTLWIGMLVFCSICLGICQLLETTTYVSLPLLAIVVFVLAWIGQFYGHKIEGKKPSFLKDIQFLMIGPAWLMSFIYRRLHLPV